MTFKILTHPVTGQTFKMGRTRPVARGPRLSLKNYILRGMPAAPQSVDYTSKAQPFLSKVLLNDHEGDCTAAAAFHIAGLMLGNAGEPIPFTDADVEKFYSLSTGYVPGDPSTDRGGDEQTVLNCWKQHGLVAGAHAIDCWFAVNAADAEEVRLAIWLCENDYFGVELPDAWINPFPSAPGFVWDVAGDPDQNNGHAFPGVGYDAQGVQIDSWGMIGTVTWAAVAKYASQPSGELYAVMSRDALIRATQKAPNGFDWTQLEADKQAIAA